MRGESPACRAQAVSRSLEHVRRLGGPTALQRRREGPRARFLTARWIAVMALYFAAFSPSFVSCEMGSCPKLRDDAQKVPAASPCSLAGGAFIPALHTG